MHPEIQDRAAAEICELLADDVEYTHETLKQMEYLERVIKESQRLCPVAAVYGRKTIGTIQLDEYVIPKGFILLLNVFALHRQKEFWGPNADKFDPDHLRSGAIVGTSRTGHMHVAVCPDVLDGVDPFFLDGTTSVVLGVCMTRWILLNDVRCHHLILNCYFILKLP